METIKVNTSQHVDIDYPVAGLGERIAARLLDLVVFCALFVVVSIVSAVTKTQYLLIIAAVIYAFYNLICEIFMDGQSVGKKLMKIKVISLDGGQASIGQYLIRWIFRIVDFVITGQTGGLICIALSDKKQRIGDIVAGTTVIKTVLRTSFEQIAFRPAEEAYIPVFQSVDQLSDADIELVHEVILTYYKTANIQIVYMMAAKVAGILGITRPFGMDEMEFLKTVVKDYNYITSSVA